jgi:hypothetical protein
VLGVRCEVSRSLHPDHGWRRQHQYARHCLEQPPVRGIDVHGHDLQRSGRGKDGIDAAASPHVSTRSCTGAAFSLDSSTMSSLARDGLAGEQNERSLTVGRCWMSIKPFLRARCVSSPVDQHLPGVECINSAEYSATGRGPVLVTSMWASTCVPRPRLASHTLGGMCGRLAGTAGLWTNHAGASARSSAQPG